MNAADSSDGSLVSHALHLQLLLVVDHRPTPSQNKKRGGKLELPPFLLIFYSIGRVAVASSPRKV